MTILRDLVSNLSKLDLNLTIYAREPWSADSEALVAPEPDEGGVPEDAARMQMKYFLEVHIAREFLQDWSAALPRAPSVEEQCGRLIRYAYYDA